MQRGSPALSLTSPAGRSWSDGLYFPILNNHVLAFCDLIAAHHVVPRNDLTSFGVDVLLFQSVARFPVNAIETYLFAGADLHAPNRSKSPRVVAIAARSLASAHASDPRRTNRPPPAIEINPVIGRNLDSTYTLACTYDPCAVVSRSARLWIVRRRHGIRRHSTVAVTGIKQRQRALGT